MSRIRSYLSLLLLAACAPAGPMTPPEIARRMPVEVADQRRLEDGVPEPGLVARYASPTGNRARVFLTPDPALANLPDGVQEDLLRPHMERAERAMGAELLARGAVPGMAGVRARSREPGTEASCLIAPVVRPPSMEAVCLAVVAGQVGTARISVAGIEGNDRERTIYAAHMAVFLLRALGRAAPRGGVAEPVTGAART